MFTVDDLQAMALEQELLAGYYRVLASRSGIETFANISLNHMKLAEHYRKAAQRILDQRKMEGIMKRWQLFGVVLLVLFALVGSVGAQDVTQEVIPVVATVNGEPVEATVEPTAPAPVESEQPSEQEFLETFMPYLTQIIIAVVIGIVALAGGAIVVAGNGMPKWARDMTQSAVTTGLDRAQQYVASTPSKADDEMLLQLREMFDGLFKDMEKVKAAVVPVTTTFASHLSPEDLRTIRAIGSNKPNPDILKDGVWPELDDDPEGQ